MINLFKNLKSRKNNDDKDAFEEFSRVYLDNKKDIEFSRKTISLNSRYFTRKNIRVVILEQSSGVNSVAYDSQSQTLKEISNTGAQIGGFFNANSNKNIFDTVFGCGGIFPQDSNQHFKIHMIRPDSQLLFTLIYPSFSQILKKIRSLSHSPSLSRSSSLGDYASLNNMVLNDLGNHQNQKRVAICVTWTCNFEDEMALKHFFHYIVHFLSLLSGLAERIAQIYQDNGIFCSEKMIKARHWFTDSFRSIFVSPRLLFPVWLTFSIIRRSPNINEAGNLQAMQRVFLDKCFGHLLSKYHTKEKNFFLARILTAILIYHQGWIHGISPEVHQRHQRLFSCQSGICRLTESPPNHMCSQLGSLLLGCGGMSLSRTIVSGSSHSQVALILYFVSYWLRTYPLNFKDSETIDFNSQPDLRKTSTRRKSASCNDPSDSGIASQEDLRRLLSSRGESRGSNGSGIHTIDSKNGTIPITQYKSSASTGSSPVKECGDRTFKAFFTRDQIISVNLAATEFVNNQRLQPKTADTRKYSIDKDTSSPIMHEPKIQVTEIPLIFGRDSRVDDALLHRSIAHFNMVGYTDHAVPMIALHGTSDMSLPNGAFSEEMRQWLKHAFCMYPSPRHATFDWDIESLSESFTDRPTSATAVLLNVDKVQVTLCTVTNDNRSNDVLLKELVSPAPLVLALLDQLHALIAVACDSSVVLQFLETALVNLHSASVILASFVRHLKDVGSSCSTRTVTRSILAQATSCHEDDVPLLYATALAHSPDICGFEDLFLY